MHDSITFDAAAGMTTPTFTFGPMNVSRPQSLATVSKPLWPSSHQSALAVSKPIWPGSFGDEIYIATGGISCPPKPGSMTSTEPSTIEVR